MKERYVAAMNVLHRFCMIVAGFCLVAITLMIPWGVFTRYVLNSAVIVARADGRADDDLVLVPFRRTVLPRKSAYRRRRHSDDAGRQGQDRGRLADRSLHDGDQPLHVLVGHQAGRSTWYQAISDFPWYSVGASYLPVPIGGLITALFVIERLWTSKLFERP